MNALIEFIFENLLILIIIGGVVYKYISNQTPSEPNEEKRRNEEQKSDASSDPSLEDVFKSLGDIFKETGQKNQTEQESAVSSTKDDSNGAKQLGKMDLDYNKANEERLSLEDQRKEQMEKLAKQLQTTATNVSAQRLDENKDASDITKYGLSLHEAATPDVTLKKQKDKFKRQLQSNLEKKELINGIIMAEVLGPPRSRKPYQSVISERAHYKALKAIRRK